METRAHEARLRNNYNLTVAQSNAIEVYQGGVCWLCGRPEHVKGRRLAHDHSHLDGLVRGRLCSQCNPLLGKLENAFIRLGLHKVPGLSFVAIVERIADYIKHPPATAALGHPVYGWAGRVGTKRHRAFIRKQKTKIIV
jgi:hypothetical protein